MGRPSGKTNGQGNGSCSSETRNSQYLDYDSVGGEIETLRRRMQVMEEVVGLLMSALQQSSNGMLFSPMVMPPVVSQVVIPSIYLHHSSRHLCQGETSNKA